MAKAKKVLEEVVEEEIIEEEAEEVYVPKLKNVMNPDTGEVIQIDAKVEKNWKKKYLHRSGVPFE